MKSLGQLARKAEKLVTDNSPLILTALGVTGTITTAVLAGRASFKAAWIIDSAEIAAGSALTARERVERVWQLYIPAVGVGALTCTCIIAANRVGNRRAAAIAAAYSMSERAFAEYREKVVEKLGEAKEQKVRDEIAQDRVNRGESVMEKVTLIVDGTKVLCHDAFSNQFFYSDMETLRKAMNDINAQILHSDYATVNDFYDYVAAEDLEHTSVSGELGWNTDKMLELEFSTVLYKEKTPCISIRFATVPIRDPWRFC